MTREEAVKNIKEHYYFANLIPQAKEALDMAIKVLEQEKCEDAISRQAALESIKNLYPDMPVVDIMGSRRKWLDKYAPYFECENAVEQLPLVNPQPRTGHWIRWYEQKETEWYIDNIPHCKCSECDKEYDSHSSQFIKYCSECGAKMIEPQESEDKE